MPLKLALEAIAQGIFIPGISKALPEPSWLGAVLSEGDATLNVSDESKRIGIGGIILSAAEIRRKEELLTTYCDDDDNDFIPDELGDSYAPFQNKPEEPDKLSKIIYGDNEHLNAKLKTLCAEYEDIFSMTLPKEPAKLPPFHIKANEQGWRNPSKNRLPPRVQSHLKNEKIREMTADMLDSGVVKLSQAEYYAQCVMQPKPHTNKQEWRLCQDYRNLNDESEFQSWPLPNTQHMFDRIGTKKARYFGVIDLTQGFHQIALSEATRVLTAYITYAGLYEYTRVPFGLKGAPQYFQKCLASLVLREYLYTICELYIDDLIIFGETEEEFETNLRKIFDRLREFGLVIKPSKVKLGLNKIEYVGRNIKVKL
jgi:hypothetical protein